MSPTDPMSQPVDPSPFSDGEPPASPRHTGEASAKECGGKPVTPTTITTTSTTTAASTTKPRQHFSRPSALKPTRRKLQKTLPKPNRLWIKRGSQDSATSSSLECGSALATPESNTAESSFIPMPTDLIDSKWLEYIERSGLMSNSEISLGLGHKTRNNTEPSPCTGSGLLPDFANLSLRRASSRPSLEHSSSPTSQPRTMSKPRKSASKRSLIATPFKIGQLDGTSPRQKEIRVVKRRASIELIAEQYQAFLESRDAEDEHDSDQDSEVEEGPRGEVMLEPNRYQAGSPVSRPGSEDRQRETILEAPEPSELPNLSPASDGTLVAFEEDAIYFKPVSFSPDSPVESPDAQRSSFEEEKPLPRPPSGGQATQPLQTAISLLVKELSSTFPQSPGAIPPDSTQSLQISTMIEAYQRLRDTVDTSNLGEAEERNVRSMFDCWLAALHTMNRSRARGASVSERHTERPSGSVPPPVKHSAGARRLSMTERKPERLGDDLAHSAGRRARSRGVSVSEHQRDRSAGVA